MTEPRPGIQMEFENRAIRAERILSAFEIILDNRSLISQDGKKALETITGNSTDEIYDAIRLWVTDEDAAKIIVKLSYVALMSINASLKERSASQFVEDLISMEEED